MLDEINSIPSGWEVCCVEDVCKLGRGRVISTEEISENPGNYPVYSSQSSNEGIMGYLNTFDFEGEYVTWTTDGANAGTVFYRKGKFNCTNVCGTLEARKPRHIDMRFISRALAMYTKKHVSYIGNPKLMNNTMAKILIKLPPFPEQRRIAEILDTLDETIRKTEALIDKLKRVKEGLLHDLLTRGIDEHGQLRDSATHPEQFKDSPLGRIPKEWSIQSLKEVSTKIQDGTHFSPQSKEGPYRYITSKNIRFGYLDLRECGWISEQEHQDIYTRCDVTYGDVLLTKDGANTGNAAINTLREPFSLLSSVAFIRVNEKLLDNEYLLQYILSPVGQDCITDIMSGLAITRLTLQKIKDFVIPVPSLQEQNLIGSYLKKQDNRIQKEQAYLNKLKQLKKGLMDDLLTGKVRVNQLDDSYFKEPSEQEPLEKQLEAEAIKP